MRTLKITILHIGRFRLDVYDSSMKNVDQGAGIVSEGGLVNSIDCGLAGLMVHLTNLLFKDEALAYEMDRRKSSDDLSREALERMTNDPTLNTSPETQRLIDRRIRGY